MSLFSKKSKDDDLFMLIADEEDSYFGSENHTVPEQTFKALTPEEVIGFSEPSTDTEETGALEQLKKRMMAASAEKADDVSADSRTEEKTDIALNTEETEIKKEEEKPVSHKNEFFDLDSYFENDREEKAETAEPKTSLFEKCRPYIVDDNNGGADIKPEASYKLESVAEILKNESKSAIDRISEKYNVAFDDLGKKKNSNELFEDSLPSGGAAAATETPRIISDIDVPAPEKDEPDIYSGSATVKFTPVSDSGATRRISVSSATRAIDLTGELNSIPEPESENTGDSVRLEQTEFDEFVPDSEFTSNEQAKSFLRKLALKKRSCFIKSVLTVLLTAALAFMKLPFMSGVILKNTKPGMIICTVILGIIMCINGDMLLCLKHIGKRRCGTDILAVTMSVSVICYAIAGIIQSEITLDILILAALILSVRSVCAFFGASSRLMGFRQIQNPSAKRAVMLINDPAVTFAMAKSSVEGDALIAAPRRTAFVSDYMKYSEFKAPAGGKMPVIALVSVILLAVIGLACASFYDGAVYGFYAAAAVACLTAAPAVFMIDSLPLYSAAKKLAKLGAVIAGRMGAERIENANAAVFDSVDLFPSGTVTLHNLQLLSNNSIDDTIIRAASLTDSLNSPLANIFKKIARTDAGVILPKSDTVKYEDKMGISGWVDNKLLFIGNRTLMEAHGIEVPSVETDRKILRNGFFPVYVAADNKACALLTVQYSVRPEIAHELRRLSALGVTMLINTSDPNMTEEMVCDYMGLYDDSVMIMSNAGCHMYKNTVSFAPKISAPAAYKGNPIGLAAIINCANKIKRSCNLLTVIYAVSAVLSTVVFTYASFIGSGSLISGVTVLLYGAASTFISYIIYLAERP